MNLLNCQQLQVSRGERILCRDLNLQIDPGQSWAILGRNGIGKTSLLTTLAGLTTADRGQIQLGAQALAQLTPQQRARQMAILFQHQEDAFPGTVLETALIGRHPHINTWQWESAQDIDLARQALAQFDLSGLEQRQVSSLSGGERQRLALATLLTQEASLLLMDEPSNHLDIHQQITCLSYLDLWRRQSQRALLMTLHDLNLALRFCDHAILMFDEGETLSGPRAEVMNQENLERLYQHPLIPVEAPWGRALLPG